MTSDRIVKPTEAAESLGVSRAFLYRLVSQGRITARTQGTRMMFLRSELDSYLANLPRLELRRARGTMSP